eukprot:Amastigsp_a508491_12.p3 type:complete len:149 gc:universal Amastigsp_a508491_12:517-963(+)
MKPNVELVVLRNAVRPRHDLQPHAQEIESKENHDLEQEPLREKDRNARDQHLACRKHSLPVVEHWLEPPRERRQKPRRRPRLRQRVAVPMKEHQRTGRNRQHVDKQREQRTGAESDPVRPRKASARGLLVHRPSSVGPRRAVEDLQRL